MVRGHDRFSRLARSNSAAVEHVREGRRMCDYVMTSMLTNRKVSMAIAIGFAVMPVALRALVQVLFFRSSQGLTAAWQETSKEKTNDRQNKGSMIYLSHRSRKCQSAAVKSSSLLATVVVKSMSIAKSPGLLGSSKVPRPQI